VVECCSCGSVDLLASAGIERGREPRQGRGLRINKEGAGVVRV